MGHNVNSRESQQQNPLQQSSIFRLKYYPSCRVKNPLLIFLNRYEEMSRNISQKRDRENQALSAASSSIVYFVFFGRVYPKSQTFVPNECPF
jgi:hypothetical protein